MKKRWMQRASFILVATIGLVIFIKFNDGLESFFNRIQQEDAVATFMSANRTETEKTELIELISEEAAKLKEEPINAYIDPVYHAVPGYNGLEVNIEQTYERNVNLPRGEKIKYVYREIEPDINLEDLGQHPIYMGNPNKKMVAYMVNVAWGNEELEQILDILKKEKIKLTFFLDGSWLKDNKPMAQRLLDEGHELANHAYSHPDMSKLSRYEQRMQIVKTNELLAELDVTTKWFAPPSGYFNQTTIAVAKELSMETILWSIDTIDWKTPPASQVITKLEKKLVPGALVLMHPTKTTVDALQSIIKVAKDKGLEVGTVTDTLSTSRFSKQVVSPLLF